MRTIEIFKSILHKHSNMELLQESNYSMTKMKKKIPMLNQSHEPEHEYI